MKNFLSQYFQLLSGKNTKRHLIFILILILLSSFFEMISVGLVAVFVSILLNPHLLISHFPEFLSNLIVSYQVSHNTLIYVSAFAIILAFIFKAILGFFETKKLTLFSTQQSHKLRLQLMSYYRNTSYLIILNRSNSAVANLLGQQITNSSHYYLLAGLHLFANIASILFISTLLFLTHFTATLTLLFFFYGFYFFYSHYLREKLHQMSAIDYQSNTHLFKGFQEFFRGYKEIKILQKEDFFINQIQKESKTLADIETTFAVYQVIPRYIIELVFVTFLIGLSIGLTIFGKHPETIISVLGLFVVAGARLMPLVNRVLSYGNRIKYSRFAVQEICNELSLIPDSLLKKVSVSSVNCSRNFERIKLTDVNFTYPDIKKPALSHINIEILAGQSIGIVGETGSGKTTLINLLIGLFEPSSGKVEVNGHDISTCPSYWFSQIAYIPQDIFLLEGTLQQNIVFGDAPPSVDQTQLKKSVSLACLDKVIENLPQGFDTMLGENGIKLSGGQRQRVALARAFYHQRNVIIMDEATSSLDVETETEIMNSIKRLHGKKTLIIISHRLKTIQNCDLIYKLRDGRIIDSGTYESVIETASQNARSTGPRFL